MYRVRLFAMSAVAVGDAAVLWVLRGAPGRAVRGLGAARSWFASAGTDHAVATLAAATLWLAAAWLALGLTCTVLARAPGALGAAAASAGRVLLPRLLVRLLAGSAGLGVLVAPVTAGAHPPPRPAPATSVAPAPVWPSVPAAARLPAPRWPSAQPAGPPEPVRPPAPPKPHPPAARSAPDPVGHRTSGPRDDAVRVRPGDSLWLLAARRLGPHAGAARIAAEWPRWYAANRTVIGPDPDHIVVGQLLQVPAEAKQAAR